MFIKENLFGLFINNICFDKRARPTQTDLVIINITLLIHSINLVSMHEKLFKKEANYYFTMNT